MKMLRAVPALPVSSIQASADFYCSKLGFTLGYHTENFAVLQYDGVRMIHLWAANDESWRSRNISAKPVDSGAESFIAGTASCRIEVEGVSELYEQVRTLGILHPNAPLSDRWWGERDFGITDPDNNLIEFYERIPSM